MSENPNGYSRFELEVVRDLAEIKAHGEDSNRRLGEVEDELEALRTTVSGVSVDQRVAKATGEAAGRSTGRVWGGIIGGGVLAVAEFVRWFR